MGDEAAQGFRGIDEAIHGRARLAIMAFLSGAGEADFTRLRDAAGLTDGNLSSNLKKLEEAGYVAITKRFEDRRPLTAIALTQAGRAAWLAYLARMEALLFPDRAARGAESA